MSIAGRTYYMSPYCGYIDIILFYYIKYGKIHKVLAVLRAE